MSMPNLSRRSCLASLACAGLLAAGAGRKSFAAGEARTPAAAGKKAVILCYTRTNNTGTIAAFIRAATGAPLLMIEPREAYAEDYDAMTGIARAEKRSGSRRELKTVLPDLSAFDVVFIGSPIWWGGISVPMFTLLSDHPLEGKLVLPFLTSGSSAPRQAEDEILALCPKARIQKAFWTPGSRAASSEGAVREWLQENKLI